MSDLLAQARGARTDAGGYADGLDLEEIIAALERAERIEAKLRELVKRAGDPGLAHDYAGAWAMLASALKQASAALAGEETG